MISYEQFLKEITGEVRRRTAADTAVRVERIRKNNNVRYDGMMIAQPDQMIVPSIRLDSYYEQYEQGVPVEKLADEILDVNRVNMVDSTILAEDIRAFDWLRKELRYRIVNAELNEERLEEIPHRRVLDFAMIYYYELELAEGVRGTVVVSRRDLERWMIDEETLDEHAVRRTIEEEPARLVPMSLLLHELDERFDPGTIEEQEAWPLFVLTNSRRLFGAACLFYPGVLRPMAERYGTDLYILPSSIHEVIVLPVSEELIPAELARMVREINRTQVEPHEVLSDHVYRYTAEEDRIERVV